MLEKLDFQAIIDHFILSYRNLVYTYTGTYVLMAPDFVFIKYREQEYGFSYIWRKDSQKKKKCGLAKKIIVYSSVLVIYYISRYLDIRRYQFLTDGAIYMYTYTQFPAFGT